MKINSIESIIKYADELVEDTLTQEAIQEAAQLKTKAVNFLSETQYLRGRIEYYNQVAKKQYELKQILKQEGSSPELIMQQLKEMTLSRISKEDFNLFISKVFQFQYDLNAFLGQEVKVVYVYQDKNGKPYLYELKDDAAAVKMDKGSRGAGLTGRFTLSQKYLNNAENAVSLDGLERNFNLYGLQQTYQEVNRRGRYGQIVRKSKNILILWKPQSVWKKMFVSSYGDINEAYAAFFLKNESSPSFSDFLEQMIDDFLLDPSKGVGAVTNLSGMLEGDVSVGNIEYAIKSKGASTLSYNQIISMAESLAALPPEKIASNLLQGIKERLHETEVARNQLVEGEIDEDVLELIRENIQTQLNINLF